MVGENIITKKHKKYTHKFIRVQTDGVESLKGLKVPNGTPPNMPINKHYIIHL